MKQRRIPSLFTLVRGIGILGSSAKRSSTKFAHSRGPTPVSVPDCDRLPSGLILTSSGFLMILDGRAPHHGGWWLIEPGGMGYARGTVQPRGRCVGTDHGAY